MTVRIKGITRRSTPELPVPIETGAAAVYPYSPGLESKFRMKTAFGEEVSLGRVVGKAKGRRLLLPRAMCPLGTLDLRSEGEPITLPDWPNPPPAELQMMLAEARTLLSRGESFVVEAPAEASTTAIARKLILDVGRHPLIIVGSDQALESWGLAARFDLGLDPSEVGLIHGKRFEVEGKKLTIAMLQQLATWERTLSEDQIAQLDRCGFVLWPECNHLDPEALASTCWLLRGRLRVGLATALRRSDGMDIVQAGHIGPVSVRSWGLRRRPLVFLVFTGWESQQASLPSLLKQLEEDSGRNNAIAAHTAAFHGSGRQCMVVAEHVGHLDQIASMLTQVDVQSEKVGVVRPQDSAQEQRSALAKPVVLATYNYVRTTKNLPWKLVLVLAAPRPDLTGMLARMHGEHASARQTVIIDLIDPQFSEWALRRREWYEKVGADLEVENLPR